MLDPMTPLGRDAIAVVFAGGAKLLGFERNLQNQTVIRSAGERLWVRVTDVLCNRVGQRIAPKVLGVIEPTIGQAVDQLLAAGAFAAAGRPRPITVWRIGRFVASLLPTAVRTVRDPDGQRVEAQRQIAAMLADRAAEMARTTTLAERVACFETIIDSCFRFAVPTLVPRIGPGLVAMNRLIALADATFDRNGGGNHRRALEVARGLPHNVTTEMDLALWQTAQTIRQDAAAYAAFTGQDAATRATQTLAGALPPVAQAAVDRFLAAYGMRGLAEIDFGRPRWRDNPTQVMQMVQSYLRIEDPNAAPDAVFARGEAAAQAVIDDLAATVRKRPFGAARAKLVYALAKRMRALAGLRETPKFTIIKLFAIVRHGLLQSGAELVAQGRLAQADDLMFLHLDELKRFAAGAPQEWQAIIADHRAVYDREKRRNQIPRLLLSDGRAFYEGIQPQDGAQDGAITGSPVSPGVVEGVVHVVFDPHAAQLAPGEILVCPGTDPAWTPLFLAAGGLIMEVGGLMTHGSVVAREYGIPAVVGVHQATERLKTGQRVRVDGSSGRVEIMD
jgi:pyruvate,water dikinase